MSPGMLGLLRELQGSAYSGNMLPSDCLMSTPAASRGGLITQARRAGLIRLHEDGPGILPGEIWIELTDAGMAALAAAEGGVS
mgnify:FL=1